MAHPLVTGFTGQSAIEILQVGLRQHQAGALDQAEAAYRQVLECMPEQADALHLLGVLHHQRGRNELAVELIGRALRQQSTAASYWNSLAPPLLALGRVAEAEASCREALRLKPDFPEALSNLGIACRRGGRPAEAEQHYRTALSLKPNYPDAHNNLGNLLVELGRLEEAAPAYREALSLQPNNVNLHISLGSALHRLERYAEAEESCRRAIDLVPTQADSHYNLGLVLFDQNRLAEAEESYRTTLALDPDHQMAHYNLSHILLVTGRLEEGWVHAEWQSVTDISGLRSFPQPLWNGEPLDGRILLVHAEQGLGDTLQYSRYLPLIARDVRIVLEVQPPLVRLLSDLSGVEQVIARGDQLPSFDCHCYLHSLPRLLGTTLETIPAEVPYLHADPAAVAAWRERLVGLAGSRLRIGLVWAGNNIPKLAELDRWRSIALASMVPLADIDGVSFFSLQKGIPAAQAANPPPGMVLHDFTEELKDFADTAALVEALDLVITVDTSVLHLAGALNKPVWLLNRFNTCWRWLLDRDDSPWYPSLRQFRQLVPKDWGPVIATVRTALIEYRDEARQACS